MFNYLLYIFDLDGTLIDSTTSINEALRLTAQDFNCSDQALATGRSMIGMQLNEILTAMGISDLEAARDNYRSHYYQYILEEKPYPGISEMLQGLHNRILLSVVTNKGHTGAHMALDNNSFLDYFDKIMTVDDGPTKPDPAVLDLLLDFYLHQGKPLEASDCLMIGDSPTDALFARNCGMDYAHVTWGFYPADSLEEDPQYYIDHPGQLLELLDSELIMEIGPELDLHGFPPHEQMKVVQSYLEEAKKRGLRELRIIHGKGRGVQRAQLHRLLSKRSDIASFSDAPPYLGGLGATLLVFK